MHRNMHTGNNVHQCPYCQRNFAHKHVFESHVRTHTGERPFSCARCGRTFGDRSNCTSHQKKCKEDPVPSSTPNTIILSRVTHSEQNSTVPTFVTSQPSVFSIQTATNGITTTTSPIIAISCPGNNNNNNHNNNNNNPLVRPGMIYKDNAEREEDEPFHGFDPKIIDVKTVNGGGTLDDIAAEEGRNDDVGEVPKEGDNEGSSSPPQMIIRPKPIGDLLEPKQAQQEAQQELVLTQTSVSRPDPSLIPTQLTCSFCNGKYDNQQELLAHLQGNHVPKTVNPTKEDFDNGYVQFVNNKKSRNMCLTCGKTFAKQEQVKIHLNVHFGDNIYTCRFCEKVFTNFPVFNVSFLF